MGRRFQVTSDHSGKEIPKGKEFWGFQPVYGGPKPGDESADMELLYAGDETLAMMAAIEHLILTRDTLKNLIIRRYNA